MTTRRRKRSTPPERWWAGEGDATELSAEQMAALTRPMLADERRRLIAKNAAAPRALVGAAIDTLERHGERLGAAESASETRGVLAFADRCNEEARILENQVQALRDASLRAMTVVNETARRLLRRARVIMMEGGANAELAADVEAMAATTRKFGHQVGIAGAIAKGERVARAEVRADAAKGKARKAIAAAERVRGKRGKSGG